METLKKYKTPIVTIVVVTTVLLVMIAVGFTIGILSEDPDGLERMMIDAGVEEPEPFFDALLGWIDNEYVIAIIGITLTVIFITGTYYILVFVKKKRMNGD